MVYITLPEAQAWAEPTKLTMAALDTELLNSVSAEILSRLAGRYVTTSWIDTTNTPNLVRKIIAMQYTAWYINRQYSSDEGLSVYARRIMSMVADLLAGLVDGAITLIDDLNPVDAAQGTAQFYPTDASSLLNATVDDMSLGGPVFTMGVIW